MRRFLAALGLLLLPLGISAAPNPAYNPRYVAQVASTSYLPTLLVVPSAVQGGGGGSFSGGSITSNLEIADTIDILLASSSELCWSSTTDPTGAGDVGLKRSAAGILAVTDCSTGTGALQVGGTTAADNSTQAFNVTTTLPTVPSANVDGALFLVTSAGSAAQAQHALQSQLTAGYTGGRQALAGYFINAATGGGTDLETYYWVSGAVKGVAVGGGSNPMAGLLGYYTSGATSGYGIGSFGYSDSGTSRAGVMGGVGTSGGSNKAGGLFYLGTTTPTLSGTTALVADNVGVASDIFQARDNGSEVFGVGDGGNYRVYRTVTAGGTTGNQTINKPAGTVNYAAAASAITVTNSLVDASSIIFGTIRTADATCTAITSIVPGAGSFVITLNAGCTAETSVGFLVTN